MKRVIAGLALALAVGAYAAHPQTLNKEGFVGVNKTQSGQSSVSIAANAVTNR